MRTIPMLACVLAAGIFSSPAFADAQSYCEVFSQDFANTRTPDVDQWEINFRNAFSDCLTQYGVDATVAVSANKTVAHAAEKVVVRPARDVSRKKRIPILSQGTMAWNSYCASKYNSFNPATGTYRSHSGRQKPCLTPSD
jgi:BA14K-like protein